MQEPQEMMSGKEEASLEQSKKFYITKKDFTNLKRNDYERVREKYKTNYVIENLKTKQIVELTAASSVHACNLIGWRPKNCRIIDVVKREENQDSITNNDEVQNENQVPQTEVKETDNTLHERSGEQSQEQAT